jgi:hypothetical protein
MKLCSDVLRIEDEMTLDTETISSPGENSQ